eukprot:10873361-Heterocapsa_arctica.AAC.1
MTGCPVSEQRLIFADKEMEDDHATLNNYSIETESMLYLAIRARGGMPTKKQLCDSIIEKQGSS